MQHKRKNKKSQLYFEAMASLLFFSIEKADESLARKLYDFFIEAFITFRQGKEGKIIEYPPEFYSAIFEANGLLCMSKRRPISTFNDATFFGLFLDEFQGTKFSSVTYAFLWRMIIQSLHYEREDFVFSYWRKAHQLLNFFLKPAERIFDDKWQIINQLEIEAREKEREEFIEFHYAIGGYLMYLKKYKLLKKIINWTNQIPPKYVLVPESMHEVIVRYMEIAQKGEYENPVYFEQKYPYPEVSGVSANATIRMWIKRYIAILFLRQYTLHPYYTYSRLLEMPSSPTGINEKKRWEDELDSLKAFTSEYLGNKKILKELKFEFLFDNKWYIDNNKETPETLINNFKHIIKEEFVKTKNEQKIDPEKEKRFQEKTVSILKSVFDEYSELFQQDLIIENFKRFYISGRYQVMDKADFAANQEYSNVNSESIVAEMVSAELRNLMLNGFALMNKVLYKLSEIDIFSAVDKLEINSEEFILIAIDLNLDYYQQLGIKNLEKIDKYWSYNEIKIININNSMNNLVNYSLFALRKIDLPNVIHIEIPKEIKDKFNPDKLDFNKHIYGKIIDLHDESNEDIRKEVSLKTEESNLSQKVIVCVDFRTEIRYKTDAKCIQLKAYRQFIDRGLSNKLTDIRKFDLDE